MRPGFYRNTEGQTIEVLSDSRVYTKSGDDDDYDMKVLYDHGWSAVVRESDGAVVWKRNNEEIIWLPFVWSLSGKCMCSSAWRYQSYAMNRYS